MEVFSALIGNEDIKNTLGASIKSSEFLHAYIIEGPRGSGKHTIARLASAAIMCKERTSLPCGKCEFCKKILNDNSTDVRFFDAFNVEDIRKIKETLYESPTECEYKIYILNDVQKMTIKAQNALLISLEEPPKNVVFFLLCTDASFLLETIRSRAQILRTKPLDSDTIFNYIKKNCTHSITDEALREVVLASCGSLGYALDMLDETKASSLTKERERAKSLVEALLVKNEESVSLLSSMFTMQRDKLKELFTLSMLVVRDLAVVKKSKLSPMCFFTSIEEASSLSSRHNLKKILSLYDSLERGINDLNTNANVPITLASLMKGN